MIFKKQSSLNIYFLSSILIGLGIVLFGINRGFDVSDEGLYVLLLDPKQANEGGVYNYDLFFKLFHKTTGLEFGIIGSRLLRLTSYFAGAYALTQFWKNIYKEDHLNTMVFMIAVLGLFAGYAFLPPSLSYNSLSVVIACFWIWLISKESPNWIEKLSLGLLLALFFYVKITVVISIGFLTLFLLVSRKQLNLKTFFLLAAPILILEGAFFLAFSESGITRIQDGFQIMANRADYDWLLLMKNNLVGIYWSFLVFLPFLLVSKFRFKVKLLFLVISIIFSCWIFIKTMITDEWSHLILIGTLVLLALQFGKRNWQKMHDSKKSVFLVLMILPFALHFGSNVYYMRLGIHYWVFWVFALLILIDFDKDPIEKKLIIFIPIVSLILMFNGIWLKPFGQIPLSSFNEVWEYKKGKKIHLTEEMVLTLMDIQEKIKNTRKEEVIAVYRNPGWIVLLGKTSPKSPGIWDVNQLNSYYPNFPDGFNFILYFPYQNLPENADMDFEVKKYDLAQGELNLLWKK